MWVPNCGSTKNTSRARYEPCKWGHKTHSLPWRGSKRFLKLYQQERQEREAQKAQARRGSRQSSDQGARGNALETQMMEKLYRRKTRQKIKGKDQEWENENPGRAFNRNGRALQQQDFGQTKDKGEGKPVTGNARGSQNTARPFHACLGCALERFRIHFSRVSRHASGKQTQAAFSLHWKWPAAFVFSH